MHAPLKTGKIVDKSTVPWYISDIAEAKHKCRQLERRWRKSKVQIDHEIFQSQRDMVKVKYRYYQAEYYSKKIHGCEGDQRALFLVINHLLHKKMTNLFPSFTSPLALASHFSDFLTARYPRSGMT